MTVSKTVSKIKLNGKPVADARSVRKFNRGLHLNYLTACAGRMPGHGRFVLLKQHFDELDLDADVSIEWIYEVDGSATTETLSGYKIFDAYKAIPEHQTSPMIVEIADARYFQRPSVYQYEDSTWGEILIGLAGHSLVDFDFDATINTTTAPAMVLYTCQTWEALADACARTGAIYWIDPFENKLMIGQTDTDQPLVHAIITDARHARKWQRPTVDHRAGIGTVRVNFDWNNTDVDPYYRQPYSLTQSTGISVDGEASIWGYTIGIDGGDPDPSNLSDLEAERDDIVASVTRWAENTRLYRQDHDLIGFYKIPPGQDISSVTWDIRGHQTYTRVSVWNHPFPEFRPVPRKRTETPPGGLVFACKMTAIGGSGTSSPADWVYRVTDLYTDEELIASIDPTSAGHYYRRPSLGRLSAATYGLITHPPLAGEINYDAWAVVWCNEAPLASRCTG